MISVGKWMDVDTDRCIATDGLQDSISDDRAVEGTGMQSGVVAMNDITHTSYRFGYKWAEIYLVYAVCSYLRSLIISSMIKEIP